AALAHHEHLEPRLALHARGVLAGRDVRDLELAEALLARDEREAGGQVRGRVADVDERAVAVAHDHDALDAAALLQIGDAGLQGLDVVAAQRGRERYVRRDRAGVAHGLAGRLVVDADRDVRLRLGARVGLARLGPVD